MVYFGWLVISGCLEEVCLNTQTLDNANRQAEQHMCKKSLLKSRFFCFHPFTKQKILQYTAKINVMFLTKWKVWMWQMSQSSKVIHWKMNHNVLIQFSFGFQNAGRICQCWKNASSFWSLTGIGGWEIGQTTKCEVKCIIWNRRVAFFPKIWIQLLIWNIT